MDGETKLIRAHLGDMVKRIMGKDITGYSLVYQGGHHNVYCNGEFHLRTAGGTCHDEVDHQAVLNDIVETSLIEHFDDGTEEAIPVHYHCDCEAWAKGEGLQGRIYAVK